MITSAFMRNLLLLAVASASASPTWALESKTSITLLATSYIYESPVASYDATAQSILSNQMSGDILELAEGTLSFSTDIDLSAGTTDSTNYTTINRAILSYIKNDWVVSGGVDIVAWGLVEGTGVVDIINQRNYTYSVSKEVKVSQPMIKSSYTMGDWLLDGYLLAGSTPKKFSEDDERLHGFFAISDNEQYTGGASSSQIDAAFRAYSSFENGDIAISYFNGVSRDPLFITETSPATKPPVYVSDIGVLPVYANLDQTGLELQYFLPTGTTLKMEYAYRVISNDIVHNQITDGDESSFGYVIGAEHSLPGIFGDGIDGTLIAEYAYDNRGDRTPATQLNNDILLAARIKKYADLSPEYNLGVVADTESSDKVYYAELSIKPAEQLKISTSAVYFHSQDGRTESPLIAENTGFFANNGRSSLYPVTSDSLVEVGATWFF